MLKSMTVAESPLPEFNAVTGYEAGGVTMPARHGVTMPARHDYDARNSRLVGDFEFTDGHGRSESGPCSTTCTPRRRWFVCSSAPDSGSTSCSVIRSHGSHTHWGRRDWWFSRQLSNGAGVHCERI